MSITPAGCGFLPANTVACLSFLRSLSHLWRQPETLTTSRNSNALETRLVSTPFGSHRCIPLELDLDGLKMLVDSPTGSLVEKEILLE